MELLGIPRRHWLLAALLFAGLGAAALSGRGRTDAGGGRRYPRHSNITATVFWVGEPKGDGSSEDNSLSAYDDLWLRHFGGVDDPAYRRDPSTNYFPRDFTPKENPFYLDVPYDDLNLPKTRAERTRVIPWARGLSDPGDGFSFMKNRWVKVRKGARVCYGQIEDAGPYLYGDGKYVFGADDRRPRARRANRAGMDVSPALRDCLGFRDLNGERDRIDWRFVDDEAVPDGPWKVVVTTSGVYQP